MSNKLTLSASDRINALLDDASFVEIGAYVKARNTDFNIQDKDTPKDGVITGYGVINGNLVYVYSQDAKVLGGSVGEMHAKKIAKIYDMAMKMGAPVPSLSDFTFMTKEGAKLFVNSPNALAENNITKLDTSAADYVSENTANVDGVFETEEELLGMIRALVEVLPSCNLDDKEASANDNPNRIIPNLDSYKNDPRAVIQNIADDSLVLEMKKEYAGDVVTALIRMDGITVGCVGNQEDTITTAGAYKAEEFVDFCDAFNIPVLTLVNVTGFAATVEEEKTISKALAKLTNAYADATVPKVTVVMDKAYGTAYTVMNSKAIGADMVYAWPDAVIGTMDPEMAVKIMYEDELAAADDKLAFIKEKKAEYVAALSGAASAASRGYIDDIIEPDATRKRVIAAIQMLLSKEEMRPYKKHGTI